MQRNGLSLSNLINRNSPVALIILSILSIQLGSAFATKLFFNLGASGTTFLNLCISAIMLSFFTKPQLSHYKQPQFFFILLFGLTLSCMELPFFISLQYIPLSIAVTITFLGPLALSIILFRHVIHFIWISFAFIGIALLSPKIGSSLNSYGLFLAAFSAIAWAAFAPISKCVDKMFEGIKGLTLSMWVATLIILPFAWAEGNILHASMPDLSYAFVVSILVSVLPMILEYRALRRLSNRSYGILLTLEPAIAAIIGFFILGQPMNLRIFAAITLITIAAIGVTVFQKQPVE